MRSHYVAINVEYQTLNLLVSHSLIWLADLFHFYGSFNALIGNRLLLAAALFSPCLAFSESSLKQYSH